MLADFSVEIQPLLYSTGNSDGTVSLKLLKFFKDLCVKKKKKKKYVVCVQWRIQISEQAGMCASSRKENACHLLVDGTVPLLILVKVLTNICLFVLATLF